MKVKRIVANVETGNPTDAERFYHDVLGLDVLMDLAGSSPMGRMTP